MTSKTTKAASAAASASASASASAAASTPASASASAPGPASATASPASPAVDSTPMAPRKLTIHHVSRIEGHAKIVIRLDEQGQVSDTQFHVTQVRGFEKFVEGRPYYEMPSITSRICGICPVSLLLASSKACDAIMAVQVPETALLLRELLHCGQFVQ